MFKLKITDIDGTVHSVPFPSNNSEIKLNNFIAYDVCREEAILFMQKELNEETPKNLTYYLYLLCRALSEFLDFPLQKILRLDTTDLLDEYGELLPEVIEDHINFMKEGEPSPNDAVAETLDQLFKIVQGVVNDYQYQPRNPKNPKVTIKRNTNKKDESGEWIYEEDEYIMPTSMVNVISGKRMYSKMTTQAAVEMLEIKSFMAKQEETRFYGNVEKYKSIRFSSYLKMCAVLLWKEGELESYEADQYEQILNEKIHRFVDIDMQTALDISFFLTSTMVLSKKIKPISIISSLHKMIPSVMKPVERMKK